MKSCIYVVIGILLVLKDANGTINLTATPYLQTFDVTHYPEGNYSRDWLITGETANYTITIEFVSCVLVIAKGFCLFDNIFIYAGSNSSASLLKQTCCGTGDISPFTVNSTDGTMYVLFSTDNYHAKEGFCISYILEGAPTSTVSTTVQVAASVCKKEENTLIYIIIACAVTALLIIIIIILICVVSCKKKSKAGKTKQKVYKTFGRSALKPVVVTSESGSEAELEGNSESPRVVQTQQHSPPLAYATVVKEQNQNNIVQKVKGNSKQTNSAQNNNHKKKNSRKNSNFEKENSFKVEKEKNIKVEKENSIKVEKENSIKQTNEHNPNKGLDPPTKREAKYSSGSKIKKSKKTDEISKEKKTVPTKIEPGMNLGKLSEEEAKSTRASYIDNESDSKNNGKINEKGRIDTKPEVRNERNVKSQIKDLDTSPNKKEIDTTPDKKDIDTTPDKKDFDTTSDKKDIETTIIKKEIETTLDKKDIDTTPNKKNIESKSDKKNIETTSDKKDIETTHNKKDIDTTPNKKNIKSTSDKKDIETTPDKKDINTTPDKKDIETTPDKKVKKV